MFYNLLPGNVEQPIAGQPVRLYQDGNGNNVFDGAPTDPLQDTQLTNALGEFRFDNLTAGTYFVQQPPEPSGNIHPAPVPIVRTIIVTPADADGAEGLMVDHFDNARRSRRNCPPQARPVSESVFAQVPLATTGKWTLKRFRAPAKCESRSTSTTTTCLTIRKHRRLREPLVPEITIVRSL